MSLSELSASVGFMGSAPPRRLYGVQAGSERAIGLPAHCGLRRPAAQFERARCAGTDRFADELREPSCIGDARRKLLEPWASPLRDVAARLEHHFRDARRLALGA